MAVFSAGQAKHIIRLAEEACAGRMDALNNLPEEDLQLVLEAVTRKREADAKYLLKHSKRQTLRELPSAPDIQNALFHAQDPALLAEPGFANSCAAKGLQSSNMKAARLHFKTVGRQNGVLAGVAYPFMKDPKRVSKHFAMSASFPVEQSIVTLR